MAFLDHELIQSYESSRIGTIAEPFYIGIAKGYSGVESLWFIFMVRTDKLPLL